MEVEENEANTLSSWQRYLRKMGSSLVCRKAGLVFCYKIEAVF
jgi:hypothetical protein